MAVAMNAKLATKLNANLQCAFCQTDHSSSDALAEHLMACGNKTERCPNCRKYIRRALFAYHYENKCANLEESDVVKRPTKATTNTDENSVQFRTYTLEKPSSVIQNQRHSLDIVECTYCKSQCARNDYETHQNKCLQNPANIKFKRQRTSLISDVDRPNESTRSKDIDYIPCEYCSQPVDFRDWSTHIKKCREKETRRIQARAEEINREAMIEKIPCDHCGTLCSRWGLNSHELYCDKNPRYTDLYARRFVSQTQSTTSTYTLPQPSYKSTLNVTLNSRFYLDQNKTPEERTAEKRSALLSHVKANAEQTEERPKPVDNQKLTDIRTNEQLSTVRASRAVVRNTGDNSSSDDRASPLINTFQSNGSRSLSQRPHSSTSLDRRSADSERQPLLPRPASSITSTSRSHSAIRSSLPSNERSRYTKTESTASDIFSSRRDDQGYQPVIRETTRSSRRHGTPQLPLQQPPMKF